MNFKNFYYKAQKSLIDNLVSLWMPGQSEEQSYLRNLLTKEEPLLTEPVFQSIFPWEPSDMTFEEHVSRLGLLDASFVDALSSDDVDAEYRFPKDRSPYRHQTSCWKGMLGSRNKTMVVTSGTGSGKTECFMIPVLQDIMKRNEKGCVQAIFLYPLNALMKSQQQRMDAWCRSVPGKITYAIYNGDTEKLEKRPEFTDAYYPQLVTRPQIRRDPPQVLFTNPTMLNYMLVRKEDQPILQRSQGKLRWILLDEAHSYTGSSAAELALQLRRVMEAFGVTADQVRFAVTSATIGNKDKADSEMRLKQFVAQITGKSLDDIVVIGGRRIIPDLEPTKAEARIGELNTRFGINAKLINILRLRKKLNSNPVLTIDQIVTELGVASRMDRERKLDIVDALGDKVEGLNAADSSPAALLPTRAHFFIRAVNGLYACPNDECSRHRGHRLDLGSLTSYQSTTCPSCGSRLLEVAACPSCGKIILTGEESVSDGYRQKQNVIDLDNHLFIESADTADDDIDSVGIPSVTEQENVDAFYSPFYLGKTKADCMRTGAVTTDYYFDMESGRIRQADDDTPSRLVFRSVMKDGTHLCPHCGNTIRDLDYFRVSATFLGRVLAPVLLENAEPMSGNDADIIYEGRKFISFTDSRQGTARAAMGINQAVERNWLRSAIYHRLADIRLEGFTPGSGLTEEETAKYNVYQSMGVLLPPVLRPEYEALERKKNSAAETEPSANEVEWRSISDEIENSTDFRKLFIHLKNARSEDARNISRADMDQHEYLTALFVDQFGWIPKRANSLENMGLVRMVYPDLKRARCPEGLLAYGITDSDWQDFLKICVDYVIRGGRHYMISGSFSDYLTQNQISLNIYPSDSTLRYNGNPVSRWPVLKEGLRSQAVSESQGRAALLLCAGMGITDVETITQEQKDLINDSLQRAWDFIRLNVLTCTDEENKGYKLNLMSPKVKLQIITDGWVCPVDSVIVDTVFKGYSPRINGYVSAQNFARFKVSDRLHYPYFPYKTDAMDRTSVKEWMAEKLRPQNERGVLSEIARGIFEKSHVYIAAEHSAQQDRNTLDRYEKEFTSGRLNILSCSTTMEMGVDIGGVSEVIMNNVPPKSANYLQRAGRAGRRNESKTLVVTFCAANPVGTNTWSHPDWPITHVTEMPLVKMESRQLIQRHVNAYLFAAFVNSQSGLNINESVEGFFGSGSAYTLFLDMLEDISNGNHGDTLLDGYRSLVRATAFEGMGLEEAAHVTRHDIGSVEETYRGRVGALQKVIEDAQQFSSRSNVVKSAERQKKNFEKTNLLAYLAENGFLPSAGIPTGLVECELDDSGKAPSMHLSQAISAYAPGTQVVKNEWCYEPAGITMKTRYDDSTTRYALQQCSHCGYATITYGNAVDDCPKCGHQGTMHGVQFEQAPVEGRFTEVVEPAGFTIEYGAKAVRKISTRNPLSFIQPVLLEMEPWPERRSSAKMVIRTSTPDSEILFYNKGKSGNGYAFCPYCGRMESEKSGADGYRPLVGHRHLKTAKECEGGLNEGSKVRRNVLLVGRYQTDFVEIQFYDRNDRQVVDQATLYSLGVIISRKLAEVLGVDDGEIDFGYSFSHDSIFIYDTALGGSGYSPLLRDYREKVLKEAYNALASCNCEQACTHCLIDRKSQWYINYLDRRKALEWLETEYKSRTAPQEIRDLCPDVVSLTSDLNSEIYAATRDRDLKSVEIFLSSDVTRWDPDSFGFRNTVAELALNGVEVSFILDGMPDLSRLDTQTLSIVVPALAGGHFRIAKSMASGVRPLFSYTKTSGVRKTYFGTDLTRDYSGSWGDGNIFISEGLPETESDPLEVTQLLSGMASGGGNTTFIFGITEDTTTSGLLATLESYESREWAKVASGLSGRQVDVSYTDRYLCSPLGCYIFAHLLKSIKEKYALTFRSLRLLLMAPKSDYSNNSGIGMTENFCDAESRDEFLRSLLVELVGMEPTSIDSRRMASQVNHDRVLCITDGSVECSIRPDAGVAHGWVVMRPFSVTIDDIESDMTIDIPLYNKVASQGIIYTVSFRKA